VWPDVPLEAVPNFSEGRDPVVIGLLGRMLAEHARLLDIHSDEDHNRSVFTLVGSEADVVDALLAAIVVARERIDLRRHQGVHPRIGAADVVPIVPIRTQDMERARIAAETLAERVGGELELPVFLYGDLGGGRGPADFRRGGPDALQARIDAGEVIPDYGPRRLHPSAGGVIIGARRPLIAFNVNLAAGATVEIAREIAAVIRERGGGFPGVRALGLDLPRGGKAQVSMNVEDWEASHLDEIIAAVEREARARGVEIEGCELVGLMPAGAAAASAAATLRIQGFDGSRLLELRLLGDQGTET
jgi:glutamate formiminotransferase